jgi:hypothetical protein
MSVQGDYNPKKIKDIKATILRPALTSHFAIKIQPPPDGDLIKFLQNKARFGSQFSQTYLDNLVILCESATLPGSTLYTHEVTNDFPGVTERMAYRRQYDNQSSFTFQVDQNYDIIEFLEGWKNFIVNEDNQNLFKTRQASYRMKFKNQYAGEIAVTKFERNLGVKEDKQADSKILNYTFIDAFPISIDSMPVSYETGTVLKCSVNFTYTRYVRQRILGSPTK